LGFGVWGVQGLQFRTPVTLHTGEADVLGPGLVAHHGLKEVRVEAHLRGKAGKERE